MNLPYFLAEISIEENLEQFLIVLSISLGVATFSRVFTWFREIPYTLLLVIVGLGLAFVDIRLVNLSPELILDIFLPPLLFEAAWNIKWKELKANFTPIIILATLGTIISIVIITVSLSHFSPLSLSTSLLIGASLSAIDPVAVIALFRELGASKKLTTLMEGESLLNDGVAVVAFILLVNISLGLEEFSLTNTIIKFTTFVGVGLGIGLIVGFGISYLTQRFDLPLVEQSLTLVSAYGTYLVTEKLGGSGVIGVVIVGLVLGNFGSRIGMNSRTRLVVSEFWDFLAFFVNSIVFLLIGDQIVVAELVSHLNLIFVAVVAVLLSRFLAIFLLCTLTNILQVSDISFPEQTILWWGGLRGSVSVALALSVPVTLCDRTLVIDGVFGVVLFTLLVQGLTTKLFLEKLNLIGNQKLKQEYLKLLAQRLAIKNILVFLSKKQSETNSRNEQEIYQNKQKLVEKKLTTLEDNLTTLTDNHPELGDITLETLKQNLLDIEANTYAELVAQGQLNYNIDSTLDEIFT